MKLKDVLSKNYFNGVILDPIRKRINSSPLQQQHDNYSLDKNIELLQKIVRSKSNLFPESQKKEFERELEAALNKRKVLA